MRGGALVAGVRYTQVTVTTTLKITSVTQFRQDFGFIQFKIAAEQDIQGVANLFNGSIPF